MMIAAMSYVAESRVSLETRGSVEGGCWKVAGGGRYGRSESPWHHPCHWRGRCLFSLFTYRGRRG